MAEDNSSIWNFDEARMRDLHYHMQEFELAFENWNLERMFQKIQLISLIVSGADWREGEWEEIEKRFEKIEKLKRNIEINKNSKNDSILFFNECKEVYKILNRKMQNKGFFFRVREDEGL